MNKSEQVRNQLQAGNLKAALRTAKDFRLGLSKDDAKAIKTAYECMVHPEFYSQLRLDIPAAIAKGEAALRALVFPVKEQA